MSVFLFKHRDKLHQAITNVGDSWSVDDDMGGSHYRESRDHCDGGTNPWPGHPEGLSNPQKQAVAFLK